MGGLISNYSNLLEMTNLNYGSFMGKIKGTKAYQSRINEILKSAKESDDIIPWIINHFTLR